MAISPDLGTPEEAAAESGPAYKRGRPAPLKPTDVIKSYRYLRIGMNIDNNFHALLIAGALGLAATAVIALWLNRKDVMGVARTQHWTTASLIGTGVALVVAWWMITYWGGFYARAHVYAAFAMFGLLIAAIVFVTVDTRHRRPFWWKWYAGVAVLMVLGAAVIGLSGAFGEHKVLVLEAYEIILFGIYWGIQTAEKWDQDVQDTGPTTVTATVAPAPGSPPSALIP